MPRFNMSLSMLVCVRLSSLPAAQLRSQCRRLAARSRRRAWLGRGPDRTARRARSALEVPRAGKDAGFDATPVIADGVIYIGDSAGTFHAVRLADGTKRGPRNLRDGGFSPAQPCEKGRLYVGDMNGIVRCLAAADGKEIGTQTSTAKSTPARRFNDDDVLFTCEAGTLTLLDAERRQPSTGTFTSRPRCAARRQSPRATSCSPAATASCTSSTSSSGKETNSVEIDAPTGSTAAMRDEPSLLRHRRRHVLRDQHPCGARQERRPSPGHIAIRNANQPMRAAAAVTDQFVAFGAQGKAIYVLNPANGEEKWKLPTRTRVESSHGNRRRSRGRRDRPRCDLLARRQNRRSEMGISTPAATSPPRRRCRWPNHPRQYRWHAVLLRRKDKKR